MPLELTVQRRDRKEKFDENKVYASVYWACRNSTVSCQESEKISEKVLKILLNEFKNKKEIGSDKIFDFVSKELKNHHKDSAFFYKSHRDTS